MERKPFKPNLSHENIWNFKAGKPETYTGCQIVDATLEAISEISSPTAENIAKYLSIEQGKLSNALDVCTGYNLAEILMLLRIKSLRNSILENLDKSIDEIAQKAGISNRSAAWKMINNKKTSHFFADIDLKKLRPKHYYKSKVGEKKDRYF